MTTPDSISQALWAQRIPLIVTHTSAPTTPFITSVPRFSYLALLLPRLSLFFRLPCSSFHHEDVLLRNLAVGLLADLYQPTLPWKLTVSDGVSWDIGDTFLNSVKEADFVRNGNANQIMKMSRADTNDLWNAVKDNDHATFTRINSRLLNAPTALKHVPLRIYIPSSPPPSASSSAATTPPTTAGAFKVVQTLVPASLSGQGPQGRGAQTLGVALRSMMPELFPSSRDPVLANVILNGVPVPFGAPLAELMREAAYPDGWLCLVVVLL
ncbi:probable Autophagy protein 5 [Cephalotrichum gorgonifer]|uniref:Autophagy protein 5 n=1 Tax=Cephalotrichum gorgonifer TaxID=2041049 RepID=A0AAE8SRI0_9PEZI|nr:probable Autophagy protein 5 [Cephalotrichum gorgonifer]